jgi:hypothetical protein
MSEIVDLSDLLHGKDFGNRVQLRDTLCPLPKSTHPAVPRYDSHHVEELVLMLLVGWFRSFRASEPES